METERRRRSKEKLRAEVLDAARDLFVREGYENFSMRALADRVGYTPAATYKHFKSKSEIFSHLSEQSFSALMQASENVKQIEAEDPVDGLKQGMFSYVEFGLQNPDHYRIAFLLHQPGRTTAPKPAGSYTNLSARVQSCIDAGRFKSGDTELMAQSLWAAAHGVTSLLIQKPEFPWVERRMLIAQVIDSAVTGLLAPREIPRSERGRHAGR